MLKVGDRVRVIKSRPTFENISGDEWSGTIIRDCSDAFDRDRINFFVMRRGLDAAKFFVIHRDDGIECSNGWYIYEDDVDLIETRTVFDEIKEKWSKRYGKVQKG